MLMMSNNPHVLNIRTNRWLIYGILWGVVFGYPVLVNLATFIRDGQEFSWMDIIQSWLAVAPFFTLFVCHQLPVRFLFVRHRIRAYILTAIAMICIFALCRITWDTGKPPRDQSHPPFHLEQLKSDFPGAYPPAHPPLHDKGPGELPPKPLILDIVISALMLGFDLAISVLLRYQEEEEKVRRLETEHLRYELEHLKSQVNPHFFMNMLNNIHGMVELNPAKAQNMIMELSHLMRYVLYEGAKAQTSLKKEISFIKNFVNLMKERFSNKKVEILLELPDENLENIVIPPLLFINIIENAFKHGISYQSHSFIHIKLLVEDKKLSLACSNSIHTGTKTIDQPGGVGITNLRQRLQLLFDRDYTFTISESSVDNLYRVNLTIPYEYDKNQMHCC